MKITLSESLSRHFSEFAFSQTPNVDRLMQLVTHYKEHHANREWANLRCAAKLVADEFAMHRPDYDEVVRKVGGGTDAIRWLEGGLLGTRGIGGPNPRLLVDKNALGVFLSKELNADRAMGGCKTQSNELETMKERVGHFVTQLVDPITGDKAGMFLSPDPVYNRAYLELNAGLTADNILAGLAIAGINVILPRILVDTGDVLDINYVMEDEVINEVRTKFDSERQSYLDSLRRIVKDCYEGLRKGLYTDVLDYAQKATNQELMVQVRGFENAMRKSDKKLLERIRVGAVQGLPSIAEAALDPKKSILGQTAIELLKVLSRSFAENATYREACDKFPMATYAYRLRSYSS